MDITKTITHLSLCSGYEGIGLGLRRVLPNLREIAYVEREGFPVANLVAKMEEGKLDAAPVFTDVKTFAYRKFRGCVDILSGGFPCQPFSAAGKRQATEDPRHLFPYIARGIKACKPRIVFLENVQGILSCKTVDGEPVLQYVLRTLEEMDYRATAGIFSAEEVGAPHQRKRVFIMGYAKSKCDGLNKTKQEGRDTLSRSSKKLGYTTSSRCSESRNGENSRATGEGEINIRNGERGQTERWMQESQRGCNATTELAHSCYKGLQGDELDTTHYGRNSKPERTHGSATQCGAQEWPSRPSERQHDWEAPRVVSDSKGKQSASRDNRGESDSSSESEQIEPRRGNSRSLRKSDGQVKSRLGGAANGSTDRVDRLRLLGNGVVPATAATAFKVLINRIL